MRDNPFTEILMKYKLNVLIPRHPRGFKSLLLHCKLSCGVVVFTPLLLSYFSPSLPFLPSFLSLRSSLHSNTIYVPR